MVTTDKNMVKVYNSTSCDIVQAKVLQKQFPGTNFVKLSYHDDSRPVSFITESEVSALCDQAKASRHGSRDELLCLLMFQACLRVSEALDIRLNRLGIQDGKYILLVYGKGAKKKYPNGKPRLVVLPESLYIRIWAYAGKQSITDKDQKLFTITRFAVLRIVKGCALKAGINRRVYNHLLRHGGSVNRLMKTGNLKSLQMFLGHSDSKMTMRYQNTMQIIQALEVESKVTFER